ncbi:putative transcriptional activator protein [Podospora australis]|uniref:Transcriptional activator protein n=1 Tax=Podospora australis TaxID=1536484 RepID=A0AAN7AIK3_9PEZI|nr:putative transcriptional activator protein [Podospora australis]
MPQGRPNNLKRQSDAGSNVLGEDASPKVKLPRLERGPDDFSGIVKTKLQSYTRTGQACDRCKVRKIRCDALPEGCSHCTTMNLECYVTDRVTGRTERRGYLQQLEREKGAMLAHIRSLEKLLENNGIEVRPWQFPGYNSTYPPGMAVDHMGNPVHDPTSKDQWAQVGLVWVKEGRKVPAAPPSERSGNGSSSRQSLVESRPHANDAHLGVTWDKEPLSSIKGTTLSILGTSLDITAAFDTPDMDEPPPGALVGSPLYNKSVMAMFQSTLNVNPALTNVELPSRHDAFTYAEWYFLMISPFLPILHKPSFIQLLTRIYDEPNFKPTVPELVNVHMVFATIYFQYGVRNREKPEQFAQLNELSNKHYHWSLSKFFDLAISQSVTAVQALAMVMAHTRNFPKPGCSLTISTFAYMKALELNLHRAVKIPGGGTTLENEMRKRVWWAILAVYSTLNGRLGRPMPVAAEEFDVEFPIAIPDEYLGEEGVLDASKIGHCNYQVGIMGFKVTPLFMEMYSKLYGVRRDASTYLDVIYELEEGMRKLLEDLPEELRVENAKPGHEVFALYCQAFCLEFTLCLRHPSVCMTDDPKFRAENTKICEETAKKLLKAVSSLRDLRSLDTTWYQLAVYVGAIFSSLVAHWERRYEATPQDVGALREDMTAWLDIIGEIGRLLGTGNRLASEVGAIVERTVGWIERDMGKLEPGATPIKQQSSPAFAMSSLKSKSDSSTTSGTGTPAEAPRPVLPANGNGYYEPTVPAGTTPYPPLAYTDQTPASSTSLQNGNAATVFDSTDGASYLFAAASAATAASVSPNSSTPAEQTNPLIAFASQATQHVAGQAADDWRAQGQAQAAAQMLAQAHSAASNTWQDWTAAIAEGATSQDRFSANALLNLGTARPGDVGVDHVGGHGADAVGVGAVQSGAWPLLIFHDGTGAGGGGAGNGA